MEFENLESGNSSTTSLEFSRETGDGNYFIRIPELDVSGNFGYFINGSPTGKKIIFSIFEDSVSFREVTWSRHCLLRGQANY